MAVLLPCLVGHGLTRLLGRRSLWPKRFLALAGRACGARVTLVGTPLPRDVLFAANHLSWLDILLIGGATGASFVSKAEVANWPVLGTLARLGGTLFVKRERRGEAGRQADALAAALRAGRPVALFAEGRTGNGVELMPFKPTLFAAVAGQAGLAVQPLRIDYGAETRAMAWPEDEPAGANALRVLGMKGRRQAVLHFLDPIPTDKVPDRKALAAQAHAAVDAAAPNG